MEGSRWACIAAALTVLAVSMPATSFAAYPGANGKIVFTNGPLCSAGRLFTVNPDGSEKTQITTGANDCDPVWSPDGAQIAFHNETATGEQDWTVRVTNADGSGQLPIADGAEATWSPDGTTLAFSRYGVGEIFLKALAGGTVTNLTNTVVGEWEPAWSPDGTQIAFKSFEPGSSHYDIYVMNADGTGRTRLTDASGNDSGPSWSPDGTRIAFAHAPASFPADCASFPCIQVHVMNRDGSGQNALTSQLGVNDQPAWSPDGTKIAFVHWTNSPFGDGLHVMNANGSGVTQLPGGSSADTAPDWQPLPLPEPTFKNASKKCKAQPGEYPNHGQCVKASK